MDLPAFRGSSRRTKDPRRRHSGGAVYRQSLDWVRQGGLLILTPIFTGDLVDQQNAAELAGTRLILDSSLSLSQKVSLGSAIVAQVSSASVTRPPNLHPAFQQAGDSPQVHQLESAIQDQIERAVTHAFSSSFLVASLLALLAALPLIRGKVEL